MIKQAFFTTAIVITAALAAGPVWPTASADAQNSAPILQLTEAERELLKLHNDERSLFGSSALQWSPQLAADAKAWAKELADRNSMQHASRKSRKGAGENLWAGTRGRFSMQQMIGAFVAEKSDFKPGVFPDVAKSGNWANVGHYTQLVWPATQEVGCAIASNKGTDFLVCRYLPTGNMRGVAIGMSPGIQATGPVTGNDS